jgi:hypothetical protein
MSISTDLGQRLRATKPSDTRSTRIAPPLGDDKSYGSIARRLIEDRVDRENTFGIDTCQDLPWTILLDVYVSMTDDRRVSDVALALASGAPSSTALRTINFMVANGDLVRTMHPNERISTTISLSGESFTTMTDYFARVADRWRRPAGDSSALAESRA